MCGPSKSGDECFPTLCPDAPCVTFQVQPGTGYPYLGLPVDLAKITGRVLTYLPSHSCHTDSLGDSHSI